MAIKQYINEFEAYNRYHKGFTARNRSIWKLIAPEIADFITMMDGRMIDGSAVITSLEKIYA